MAQVRPFVPAENFAVSKAFYQAIGFTIVYQDDGVAIMDYDGAGFVLQNYFVKEFAHNSMHQLLVSNLDEWWPRTEGLVDQFGVQAPKTPAMQPWGIRVGFLVDPSGVLWHVTEP